MAAIVDIEGIGPAWADKLKAQGITTTDALLKEGATPAGRKAIAAATTIDERKILEWVNHADLARINGVGWEYADLLEAAGVDTIPELAQRNAENLYATLVEVNESKKLVRRMPSTAQIEAWIAEARSLPASVSLYPPVDETNWRARLPPLRRRSVPATPAHVCGILESADPHGARHERIEADLWLVLLSGPSVSRPSSGPQPLRC
jgi:predicted flap endonuclease-1-like 5' DNA nuclease